MTNLDFFKGKRVVVTGATGLIGSYVVKLLIEIDAYVCSVTHRRAWPFNLYDTSRYFQKVDLLDAEAARSLMDDPIPDVVLSCAGITGGVGLTTVDPISYVTQATTIALNTLHAAQAAGVPLFGFLSSTTVYPASDRPVREEASGFALRPEPDIPIPPPSTLEPPDFISGASIRYSAYGEPYPLYAGIGYSKRFLEQLCAYVSDRTATKCAIVRPSGAYGRYDNFDERTSHVVPGMIRRALSLKDGEPFVVWGDGQDVRDIVHAEDVARGLLLSVAATGGASLPGRPAHPDIPELAPADPINIASGVGVTTRDLARVVLDACGRPRTEIVFDTSKPTALKTRLVSIQKAIRVLGYAPKVSLEAGLKDTIDWYRRHHTL